MVKLCVTKFSPFACIQYMLLSLFIVHWTRLTKLI